MSITKVHPESAMSAELNALRVEVANLNEKNASLLEENALKDTKIASLTEENAFLQEKVRNYQTKVHAATPTLTPTKGETKAPAPTTGSEKATAPTAAPVTILKDVFEFPNDIPEDMCSEEVQICQEAKEINKYNVE